MGAVTSGLKQCETERILLTAEHAADQPFIVLRYPIASAVLGDFEMVRRRYRMRRKVGHAHSANPVIPLVHRLGDVAEEAMSA